MGIFDNDGTCCTCGEKLADGEEMMCAKCDERATAAKKTAESNEQQKKMAIRGSLWKKICPEDYRAGSVGQMPKPLLDYYNDDWNPLGERSLFLIGESGVGKTTGAFILAKSAHFKMVRVKYITASDIRQQCIDAARSSDASFIRYKNRLLEGVELMIIDDFGNTASSAASDEHLLAIMEAIRARGIRTIITTQYTSQEMIPRFSTKQIGEAICRRAAKNSAIIRIQ